MFINWKKFLLWAGFATCSLSFSTEAEHESKYQEATFKDQHKDLTEDSIAKWIFNFLGCSDETTEMELRYIRSFFINGATTFKKDGSDKTAAGYSVEESLKRYFKEQDLNSDKDLLALISIRKFLWNGKEEDLQLFMKYKQQILSSLALKCYGETVEPRAILDANTHDKAPPIEVPKAIPLQSETEILEEIYRSETASGSIASLVAHTIGCESEVRNRALELAKAKYFEQIPSESKRKESWTLYSNLKIHIKEIFGEDRDWADTDFIPFYRYFSLEAYDTSSLDEAIKSIESKVENFKTKGCYDKLQKDYNRRKAAEEEKKRLAAAQAKLEKEEEKKTAEQLHQLEKSAEVGSFKIPTLSEEDLQRLEGRHIEEYVPYKETEEHINWIDSHLQELRCKDDVEPAIWNLMADLQKKNKEISQKEVHDAILNFYARELNERNVEVISNQQSTARLRVSAEVNLLRTKALIEALKNLSEKPQKFQFNKDAWHAGTPGLWTKSSESSKPVRKFMYEDVFENRTLKPADASTADWSKNAAWYWAKMEEDLIHELDQKVGRINDWSERIPDKRDRVVHDLLNPDPDTESLLDNLNAKVYGGKAYLPKKTDDHYKNATNATETRTPFNNLTKAHLENIKDQIIPRLEQHIAQLNEIIQNGADLKEESRQVVRPELEKALAPLHGLSSQVLKASSTGELSSLSIGETSEGPTDTIQQSIPRIQELLSQWGLLSDCAGLAQKSEAAEGLDFRIHQNSPRLGVAPGNHDNLNPQELAKELAQALQCKKDISPTIWNLAERLRSSSVNPSELNQALLKEFQDRQKEQQKNLNSTDNPLAKAKQNRAMLAEISERLPKLAILEELAQNAESSYKKFPMTFGFDEENPGNSVEFYNLASSLNDTLLDSFKPDSFRVRSSLEDSIDSDGKRLPSSELKTLNSLITQFWIPTEDEKQLGDFQVNGRHIEQLKTDDPVRQHLQKMRKLETELISQREKAKKYHPGSKMAYLDRLRKLRDEIKQTQALIQETRQKESQLGAQIEELKKTYETSTQDLAEKIEEAKLAANERIQDERFLPKDTLQLGENSVDGPQIDYDPSFERNIEISEHQRQLREVVGNLETNEKNLALEFTALKNFLGITGNPFPDEEKGHKLKQAFDKTYVKPIPSTPLYDKNYKEAVAEYKRLETELLDKHYFPAHLSVTYENLLKRRAWALSRIKELNEYVIDSKDSISQAGLQQVSSEISQLGILVHSLDEKVKELRIKDRNSLTGTPTASMKDSGAEKLSLPLETNNAGITKMNDFLDRIRRHKRALQQLSVTLQRELRESGNISDDDFKMDEETFKPVEDLVNYLEKAKEKGNWTPLLDYSDPMQPTEQISTIADQMENNLAHHTGGIIGECPQTTHLNPKALNLDRTMRSFQTERLFNAIVAEAREKDASCSLVHAADPNQSPWRKTSESYQYFMGRSFMNAICDSYPAGHPAIYPIVDYGTKEFSTKSEENAYNAKVKEIKFVDALAHSFWREPSSNAAHKDYQPTFNEEGAANLIPNYAFMYTLAYTETEANPTKPNVDWSKDIEKDTGMFHASTNFLYENYGFHRNSDYAAELMRDFIVRMRDNVVSLESSNPELAAKNWEKMCLSGFFNSKYGEKAMEPDQWKPPSNLSNYKPYQHVKNALMSGSEQCVKYARSGGKDPAKNGLSSCIRQLWQYCPNSGVEVEAIFIRARRRGHGDLRTSADVQPKNAAGYFSAGPGTNVVSVTAHAKSNKKVKPACHKMFLDLYENKDYLCPGLSD
ncbi:hypothetical protein GW915_05980 [bacterium]|nr:hypothetical protein [bacterium]